MLDPNTTAIVIGAAGNLVAQVVSQQVDLVRDWVVQTFRGASDEDRSTTLGTLNADIDSITRGDSSSQEAVRMRWCALLASHLAAHPEALNSIRAMADGLVVTGDETMMVGVQRNEGSGVFIGRDFHGNITGGARD